jgi:transposase
MCKKLNIRRKVATSGGEKQSDEWKFKETKMRSNKIGVLETVNVLKNKSKKTACPWRIFASRFEAGSCSDMRSTG